MERITINEVMNKTVEDFDIMTNARLLESFEVAIQYEAVNRNNGNIERANQIWNVKQNIINVLKYRL